MKKLAHLLSIVLGTSMFVACDDSTSADNSGDYTVKVDTVYSVSKDTVFVMEKDTVVLNNRDTVVLNQRDTVVRMDTVVLDKKDTLVLSHADTVVLNHRDTVVVIDTVLGLNDDHCSLNNDFGTKALIVCGEDSTWISKVMWCGATPYNPEEQFCVGDQLYDLCGEKTYDPELYVCSPEKKVLPLCGTNGYDPETQFCFKYNSTTFYVMKKCDGMNYVPMTPYYSCSEDNKLLISGTDYRVIQLDTLLWMADNLKDEVSDAKTYCGGATGGFKEYFIDGNCETYGRLYQPSVIATLGDEVCPDGWRLPTMEELSAWIGSVIETSWTQTQFPGYIRSGPLQSMEGYFWIWSGTKVSVHDLLREIYVMRYDDSDGWREYKFEHSGSAVYGSIRCVKKVVYNLDGLLM